MNYQQNLLISAAGNFDQMVAELGFDRTEDLADVARENHFVKFLDHLSGRKLTQPATLFARRALALAMRILLQ
jgi:hypothetical protein